MTIQRITGPHALLALTCCLLMLCIGCAKTATTGTAPATPNPPQVTVLQYAQLGAAAVNTASGALVALCVPPPPATPELNLVTCNQVKKWLLTLSCPAGMTAPGVGAVTCPSTGGIFDQVAAEANSTDTWAVMKPKIAAIIGGAIAATAVSDPGLQVDITGITSIFTQILGVV